MFNQFLLDLLIVKSPNGTWEKVIFTRMNSGNETLGWGSKWNQTGNLTFDGSKNICTIPDGQWDCDTNVTWKAYSPRLTGLEDWDPNTNTHPLVFNETNKSYETEIEIEENKKFVITVGQGWAYKIAYSDGFEKNKDLIINDADDNVNVLKTSKYRIILPYNGKAKITEIKYNVTEYNLYDDGTQQILKEKTAQSYNYNPTQADIDGYVSKGIFTNKDHTDTNKYTGKLTGDTTLYHYYEKEIYDYVYLSGLSEYFGPEDDKNRKVFFYSWSDDSKKPGDDISKIEGTEIDLNNYVSLNVNFNSYALYRYPLLTNGNEKPTQFIIYTTGTEPHTLSAHLKINYGHYYDLHTLLNGISEGTEGSRELGNQASLVWEINEERLNAGDHVYEGKTWTKSICSFSLEKINTILTKYEELGAENVAFNNAKFFTNDVDNKIEDNEYVRDQADYFGSEIIRTLRIRKSQLEQSNPIGLLNSNLFKTENESPAVLIIIITISSIGALGLFYILKKRKNEK